MSQSGPTLLSSANLDNNILALKCHNLTEICCCKLHADRLIDELLWNEVLHTITLKPRLLGDQIPKVSTTR